MDHYNISFKIQFINGEPKITQIQLEKSTKNWLATRDIKLIIVQPDNDEVVVSRLIHLTHCDIYFGRTESPIGSSVSPRQNAFISLPIICSSAHSKCVRTAALLLARLTAALHLSLHNSEVITPFRPFLQLKIFRPGRRNFTADFQEEKICQNGIKADCFFESCRYCGVPQK